MTKKLFILAYIVGVLLLSGMVKAAEIVSQATVTQFAVNPSTGILNVAGVYPSPCHTNASVTVSNIDNAAHVLHLTVTAEANDLDKCTNDTVKPFTLSYDLTALSLQTGATYLVDFGATNNTTAVQYIALSAGNTVDYRAGHYENSGVLVAATHRTSRSQGFALQTESDGLVSLVSPGMSPEFLKYLNQQVNVTGYKVQLGQIGINPETQQITPTFVVLPVSIGL